MGNMVKQTVTKPIAKKLGFVEKGVEGSSMLEVSAEEKNVKKGFLAKKGKVTALDSPTIQKRIEELSGKKVDAKKLKKSFSEDEFAPIKTVLGSVPMFNYLSAKRGKALDKDTSVDGLQMMQTAETETSGSGATAGEGEDCNQDLACNDELAKKVKVKATPPLVEAEMEGKALVSIYEDYQKNYKSINEKLGKQLTNSVAGPVKAAQIMAYLIKEKKLQECLEDALKLDCYAMPVEDEDPEVEDFLAKRENSQEPPDEMGELSDIPDWLSNKI